MTHYFHQIRNELRDIEAIADSYKTKIPNENWLAYGLQKDAIQNSWDARKNPKGINWECGFSLLKINQIPTLCISDSGTTGLNGDKFSEEGELLTILNSNLPKQDLAYFLNSNWSVKDSEAGGNRGRGKTLFLATSQNKMKLISFDSFRASDNSYIFGQVFVDNSNQVKFHVYYDEIGRNYFNNKVNYQIKPLSEHGTRVFISNPDKMVVSSIENGEMLAFIGSTRWEIIKKYGAKIFVDNGKEKLYATSPDWYSDVSHPYLYHKEFSAEYVKSNTRYKTKRLVLRYDNEQNLPESLKGIAIQRGGMTIQRISTHELLSETGIDGIYGWIELENEPLEKELKINCEGPEHLDYNWTIKPATYLRAYLKSKAREYAREFKISKSELAKASSLQKSAQKEALKLLGPVFKDLKLTGKFSGKRTRREAKRNPNEPFRLSIPDLKFPQSSRRVNFEEVISGTYVIPINDTEDSLMVIVKVYISPADGSEPIILQEKEFNLVRGRGPKIGLDSINIDKRFKKGKYVIKAQMRSIEDTEIIYKGNKVEKSFKIYDRINQTFFVEQDPPESGPIDFQGEPREDKDFIFRWEEDNDGYIIYYNESHPRIKPLLKDEDKLKEYLYEQGILIALQIKLEENLTENAKDDPDFGELVKSRNPANVWDIFVKKYSQYLWENNK